MNDERIYDDCEKQRAYEVGFEDAVDGRPASLNRVRSFGDAAAAYRRGRREGNAFFRQFGGIGIGA